MAEYITELANDIAKSCPDLVENGCGNDNCVACLAFKLIGLGYKKQDNTADVVPKSEADEIAEELSDTIVMKDELFDEVIKLRGELANAKTEVAREIFEEIERFLYLHFRFCKEEIGNDDTEYVKGRMELNTQIQNFIAELKKKYTEGEE